MPGGLGACINFCDAVVLKDHPLRDRVLAWLRHGVLVYECLHDDISGSGLDSPFRIDHLPGEIFPNRVPAQFVDFVDTEVQDL